MIFWAWVIRALLRCGNWGNTTNARSGLIVNTNNTPTNVNTNIGFRADSNYGQKLYSYGIISRARFKGIQSPCQSINFDWQNIKTAAAWLVGNSEGQAAHY